MNTMMMALTLHDMSTLKGALRLAERNSMDARAAYERRLMDDTLSKSQREEALMMYGVCEREWQRVSDLLCEMERLEDALYDKMADNR